MTAHARSRLLLLGAVLFTVVAVHYAAGHQQAEAERTQARVDVVDHLRIAMVDQETGLRGFAQTGEATFLNPFYAGRRQFANDLEEARRLLGDDAPAASPLTEQASVAAAWQESALRAIASVRARGMGAIRSADARKRKAMMDRFRVANSELDAWVREDRASSLTAARRNVDLAVIIVGALFGLAGLVLVERRARGENRERSGDAEFSAALQASQDEAEAGLVVVRHIERIVPGTTVSMVGPDAEGDSGCLALRTGAAHERGTRKPLQPCGRCGKTEGQAAVCVPAVAGGQTLGAVVATRRADLREAERERICRAVVQATPVLANLRNLETARHLSRTDSLTGLPNARAVQDQLERLAAAAGRHATPLCALVIDLDHFKALNDGFGHQAGDDVLAAVGSTLREGIRASDFAGRWGGEEFLVLLPNTDAAGGRAVAEKLRVAIAAVRVPGVSRGLTATIGVAALPEHAGSGDELVRAADGALYVGKAAGRNRIELHVSARGTPLDDPQRLAVVRALGLLDADAPAELQRITSLAVGLAEAPTACITLVEPDRQFFAGHHGLASACRETPISHSFCRYAVTTGAEVIASDAREHRLLAADSDLIGIGAYAGFPLEVEGQVVGALCVFDTQARAWTPGQLASLDELAGQARAALRGCEAAGVPPALPLARL